jgi:hypothetical protein
MTMHGENSVACKEYIGNMSVSKMSDKVHNGEPSDGNWSEFFKAFGDAASAVEF